MKSSSGAHYIALDHVRALAAFMVFTWHFTHSTNGYPVSFNFTPTIFPLAIFDEGHTGVALFMTLSGYLFAKLLDGKDIHYKSFIWNRILRLLPLLTVVIIILGVIEYIENEDIFWYLQNITKGIILPTLPNGGWSITVEFHYYLILPFLLWMFKKSKLLPLIIIIAALSIRALIHYLTGEVQSTAYWTIVGRIDQFTLGMLMFQLRTYVTNRHYIAILVALSFSVFFWYFDFSGGWYNNPTYPSPSRWWILLPTIEGLSYAILIAWYESSFQHSTTGLSKFISRIGDYSFSIYLLHFFIVFHAARFINEHIMDISNFYLACLWSTIIFISLMPIGYLSYRYIESPFLKHRKKYIVSLN